jgi:hypothetical protein
MGASVGSARMTGVWEYAEPLEAPSPWGPPPCANAGPACVHATIPATSHCSAARRSLPGARNKKFRPLRDISARLSPSHGRAQNPQQQKAGHGPTHRIESDRVLHRLAGCSLKPCSLGCRLYAVGMPNCQELIRAYSYAAPCFRHNELVTRLDEAEHRTLLPGRTMENALDMGRLRRKDTHATGPRQEVSL